MQTEIKSVFNFYEGPHFLERRRTGFNPQKEYEIREDYEMGSIIVSSRRMRGRFTGTEIQKLVDLKMYFLDLRLPEPKGVMRIEEAIN